VAVYEKCQKFLVQGRRVEDFRKVSFSNRRFSGELGSRYEKRCIRRKFLSRILRDERGEGRIFSGTAVIALSFVDGKSARQRLHLGGQDVSDRSERKDSCVAKNSGIVAPRGNRVVCDRPALTTSSHQNSRHLNTSPSALGDMPGSSKISFAKNRGARSLSDKFCDARVIENASVRHGPKIRIERGRARNRTSRWAAASILCARTFYIRLVGAQGKDLGG